MQSVTNPSLPQPLHGLMAAPALAPVDEWRFLYVRGLMALRDGAAEDAIGLITQALRREPGHAGMRLNLVRALLVAGRFDQVVPQAQAALSGTAADAELHFARGTALNALGQPSAACGAFAKALALAPDHAASWLNMGNASADLSDLTSAEIMYRTAIRLDPALPEAFASLGHVLIHMGRLAEAMEACETAIRLRPDFVQAHWNLANVLLLAGDYVRGFAEYEWRRQHARYRRDFPPRAAPRWHGSAAAGQTILVRAEQGFGDTIQFLRYLPLIQATGARIILVCAAPLMPLACSIPGVVAVTPGEREPPSDAWIDLGSLPLAHGTTLANIPAPEGYLRADPDRVRAWQACLPAGRKIGIALAGNPRHPADRLRSVPMSEADKLLERRDLCFVNLQHGPAARELPLPDLTGRMTDYAQTAALIETLDLVISADTSVAHLAGALGKPVWLMLPFAPDWRWLMERPDSPWYRSAWLFRQKTPGDWADVTRCVRAALDEAFPDPAPPDGGAG